MDQEDTLVVVPDAPADICHVLGGVRLAETADG